MTTVQYYIKELLFEQDCVVIPEFGGFITHFDCAKISVNKKNITPPQKWLAFNSLLKNDDGLLSNFIAQEESISIAQASFKVKSFVEDMKRNLRIEHTYSIEGLGIFSLNEEDKIQFQSILPNNFFGESFGMENLFVKNLEPFQNELQILSKANIFSDHTIQQVYAADDREPMADVLNYELDFSRKKSRFRRVLPFMLVLLCAVFLSTAIYLYDNQQSNLSSLNPFQFQLMVESVISPIVKKDVSLKTPKVIRGGSEKIVTEIPPPPIDSVKSVIIEPENRFFIITGSFGSKHNAQKLLNILKSSGFENASIIYPTRNEKLIKVSAAGFTNESMADQESSRVSEALNQSTWIYRK